MRSCMVHALLQMSSILVHGGQDGKHEAMVRKLEAGTTRTFEVVRECKDSVVAAGLRCLLGMICRSHVPWSWWSWSPTNPSSDGSSKRHGCWRRSLSRTICGHVWTMLRGLWCGHNVGPSRQLHSQLSQRPGPQGSTHSLSVFSCVGGCTYPSPCLTAPADVTAYSTSLATIAQRVPRQGCWGGEAFHWSAQRHRFAGKVGLV